MKRKVILIVAAVLIVVTAIVVVVVVVNVNKSEPEAQTTTKKVTTTKATTETTTEETTTETTTYAQTVATTTEAAVTTTKTYAPVIKQVYANGSQIGLDMSWPYADYTVINSGTATLYKPENSNGITVAVNAGHGTSGGTSKKTYCHPDMSAKVTGGTTAAGSTMAVAVSVGMTFSDGTDEAVVNLNVANLLKNELLSRGYNVLMIRESSDVQLDNIARVVIANNVADCHIALHFDSTSTNKGAFFMSTPDVASYKAMEPVASHWQAHHAFGYALIDGLRNNGSKIWSSGALATDSTLTSYATIPTVTVELGDKTTPHDEASLAVFAIGLANGVDSYFGKS